MSTQTRQPRNRAKAAPPPLVAVPTFRPPTPDLPGPPAEEDMPLIEERTTGPTVPNRPPAGGEAFSTPSAAVGDADTIRTRTGTSSAPTKAETIRTATAAIGAAIGVTAMLAGIVAARVFGRMLRPPTTDQRRDIAAPLARIAQRRLDLTKWSPDLVDGVEAAEAVGAYLQDGPIAPRLVPVQHIGMEHGTDTPPADDPTPTTPAAPSAAQIWHDATSLDMQPSALNPNQPKPEVSYAP